MVVSFKKRFPVGNAWIVGTIGGNLKELKEWNSHHFWSIFYQ